MKRRGFLLAAATSLVPIKRLPAGVRTIGGVERFGNIKMTPPTPAQIEAFKSYLVRTYGPA